jgi:hypothetical protein
MLLAPVNIYGNELFDYIRPSELATDAVLMARHPKTWNLARSSRTWHAESAAAPSGPFVSVYGPLYDQASLQVAFSGPPPMPYWSYDNGDLRILVSRDRLK